MPIRTCAVCRKKAEKESLLRFVLAGQRLGVWESGERMELLLDALQQASGRGAYCHADTACFCRSDAGPVLAREIERGRERLHAKLGLAKNAAGVSAAAPQDLLLQVIAGLEKGKLKRREKMVLARLKALAQKVNKARQEKAGAAKKPRIRI